MHNDLDAWLAESKPNRQGRCLTCGGDADLREYIARFALLVKDRKTALSFRQFYDDFLAPRGYEVGYPGLMNHVRNCLGVVNRGDK
jgi:hypothetical protein